MWNLKNKTNEHRRKQNKQKQTHRYRGKLEQTSEERAAGSNKIGEGG